MAVAVTNDDYKKCIMDAPIAAATKRSYVSQLNMWLKYHDNLAEIIGDPDKYADMVARDKPLATRNAMFKVIIALLKHCGAKDSNPALYHKWYNGFFRETNANVKEEWNQYKQAPKTLEGAMTWRQIIDAYNEVSRSKPYSLDHLTLAMYVIIPPRRQRDYWKLAIVRGDADWEAARGGDGGISGYIDLRVSPGVLIVSTFKTQKTYNEWRKVLPAPLDNIVRRYLAKRDGHTGTHSEKGRLRYLFEKKSGEPYPSHDSFTVVNNSVLKRVLGESGASVNVIRHAASTWVFYNSKMTPLEKKNWALDMGHSVDMQGHYVM